MSMPNYLSGPTALEGILKALSNKGWVYDIHRDGMVHPGGSGFTSMKTLRQMAGADTFSPTAVEIRMKQQEAAAKLAAKIDDNIVKAFTAGVHSPMLVPSRQWTPYQKLEMRVGVDDGGGFDAHVNIMVGTVKTFVFIVKNEKAIILEDDTALFPSDAVVAQYHLFMQAAK